ncbi:hypothetical protein [Sphingomicrobium flavum]|uniref:hypothetical protein n=1 Tax=Sphingomicrobium flavum TaxID=1229164 RepID=UPI0021AD7659|nr:hypothetical protein [Sphingomicrobium flavum]
MERVTGKYDSAIDLVASALMAAAFGWSLTRLAPGLGLAATGACVLAAFALTHAFMRLSGVARKKRAIEPAAIEPLPFDESALAEAEAQEAAEAARPLPPPPSPDEPLVLDDILAEMQPESRVARLFGAPDEVPTAGELKERIDRHLGEQPPLLPERHARLPEDMSTGQQIAAALMRARAERR